MDGAVFGEGVTDAALFAAAAAGDDQAFAQVVERHADAVYNHCLRCLGYRPEADDVASMTFFEAWRKRDTVRFIDESALPWLLSVATNVARNASRARRRYDRLLSRLPREDDVPDIAEEAVRRVEADERAARVSAAVARLRPEEQDVIALCDLSGLSYSEAAAALNLPVGTVRSRLSRGRERLRQLLMKPDPNPGGPQRQGRMRSLTVGGSPIAISHEPGER